MTNNPPLSIGMPYQTLIGYIAADSVCKNSNTLIADQFIRRQTNNDTLNYIMKYFYWMVDYNPIAYYNYAWNNHGIKPSILEVMITNQLAQLGVSKAKRFLSESFFVLHVMVDDTIIVDEVGGAICSDLTVVSSTILDTIKGQVIPVIDANPALIEKKSNRNNDKYNERLKLQSTGANFIFNFCNQWEMGRGSNNLLNDGLGNAWIKPNTEYILFLEPRRLCRDSANLYISVCPSSMWSVSAGMFPVIGGNVQDAGNEFGLGTSVPLAIFKMHLETLISQIKYYGE